VPHNLHRGVYHSSHWIHLAVFCIFLYCPE